MLYNIFFWYYVFLLYNRYENNSNYLYNNDYSFCRKCYYVLFLLCLKILIQELDLYDIIMVYKVLLNVILLNCRLGCVNMWLVVIFFVFFGVLFFSKVEVELLKNVDFESFFFSGNWYCSDCRMIVYIENKYYGSQCVMIFNR